MLVWFDHVSKQGSLPVFLMYCCLFTGTTGTVVYCHGSSRAQSADGTQLRLQNCSVCLLKPFNAVFFLLSFCSTQLYFFSFVFACLRTCVLPAVLDAFVFGFGFGFGLVSIYIPLIHEMHTRESLMGYDTHRFPACSGVARAGTRRS